MENFYPISELRVTLISMECIVILFSMELSFVFLTRYLKREKNIKHLQDKAYFGLFFGFGLSRLLYIISDFFIEDISSQEIWRNLGYFLLILAAFYFVYSLETYKIFFKKYFFTLCFSVLLIVYILFMFISLVIAALISHLFWPIFTWFFLLYLITLDRDFYKKKATEHFKRNFLLICFGTFFLIGGYQFTLGWTIRVFGTIIFRLIGDFMQIVGLMFLFIFFISIPSFSEYDWQEELESIYIVNKAGLFLFKKNFLQQDDISPHDPLISGLLTNVKLFIDQSISKEKCTVIEKSGKIIIMYSEDLLNGFLICKKNLESLQILLKNLIERISIVYKDILSDWNGEMKFFQPIGRIISKVFY